MRYSHEALTRFGVGCACTFLLAACGPRPAARLSVDDLLHDRVTLDGVVMKCNGDLKLASKDPECATARIAIDRLAEEHDAAVAAQREAEFERRRAALRLAQEQARLQQEAAQKVDAYSLPIVPINPPPAPIQATGSVPADGPATAMRARRGGHI